jgi:hypothetical protein
MYEKYEMLWNVESDKQIIATEMREMAEWKMTWGNQHWKG